MDVSDLNVLGLGAPGLSVPGMVAPRLAVLGLVASSWVIGLIAPHEKV
jgi:hypothetical protein